MPSFKAIELGLTLEQMGAYLATVHWLANDDPAKHMQNPHMRFRAAAAAYAGGNKMAHHRDNTTGVGMTGGAAIFSRLWTPESAKLRAGEWLRIARLDRALGYKGRVIAASLSAAAKARRAAADRMGAKCC